MSKEKRKGKNTESLQSLIIGQIWNDAPSETNSILPLNSSEGGYMSSADPEGGTGGPDPPPPCKITSKMGFYRE